MGPWYSPYRDGPDPKLVARKRMIIKMNEVTNALKVFTETMRRIGLSATEAGLTTGS